MLTINCRDKKITLNEIECQLSTYFSKCVQYTKEIWVPYDSKSIQNYIDFLFQNYKHVDLSQVSAVLDYFSENKSIDNFVSEYIKKVDPCDVSEIILFYDNVVKYVNIDYNMRREYLINLLNVYFEATFGVEKRLMKDFSVYNFHYYLPKMINILHNEENKTNYPNQYNAILKVVKSVVKNYFFNKNKIFEQNNKC